jgi:hypothetical protein
VGTRLRTTVVLLVAAAALAACGAPQYTYITDSDDHTYLKVPATWQKIDPKVLDKALGFDPTTTTAQRGVWLQGYDAAQNPSPDHVFGDSSDVPAVLIAVQQNTPTTQGKVSLDGMRDFFYPVSAGGRQAAAMSSAAALSGFKLMSDEVLTPGHGLRGVHDVFTYSLNGGPPQVFDQTMYANDDASKLYMFYVRCSADCYQQRQREITAVASSFTVRETP